MTAKPSVTFWEHWGLRPSFLRGLPECSYRGSNRTEARAYDKEKDKLRKQVERFFNKLKPCRRMATR